MERVRLCALSVWYLCLEMLKCVSEASLPSSCLTIETVVVGIVSCRSGPGFLLIMHLHADHNAALQAVCINIHSKEQSSTILGWHTIYHYFPAARRRGGGFQKAYSFQLWGVKLQSFESVVD